MKINLPNMVYYNDDHSKSPKCTSEVIEILQATYTLPSTWQELSREIENGEDKIIFHLDMIIKSVSTAKEFIKSINTIAYFAGHITLKIFVLITPHTTQQQVQELKESGALGIGVDMRYYSVEEAVLATNALVAGEPYWPEHIISKLPHDNRSHLPRVISIRINENEPDIQRVINNIKANPYYNIDFSTTWHRFEELMTTGTEPSLLLFHAKLLDTQGITSREIVSMISSITRITLGKTKTLPIGVVIDNDTTQSTVNELRRLDILGIVPSSEFWGVDLGIPAVVAMLNGQPSWPEHIISQLPVTNQEGTVLILRPGDNSNDHADFVQTVNDYTNCRHIVCNDWSHLTTMLSLEPCMIIFYVDSIKDEYKVTIKDFMQMLRTLVECNPNSNKNVKLASFISTDTVLDTVIALQNYGVDGIIPRRRDFSDEERLIAEKRIHDGEKYYPDHIIKQLPTDKTVLVLNTCVYIRNDCKTHVPSKIIEQNKDIDLHIVYCNDLSEFTEILRDYKEYDVNRVMFHENVAEHHNMTFVQLVDAINSLIKLHSAYGKLPVALLFNQDTNLATIQECKSAGVKFFVPGRIDFGLKEFLMAMRKLNIYYYSASSTTIKGYYPDHIFNQLTNNRGIVLTFRPGGYPMYHKSIRETLDSNENINCKHIICNSWEELGELISSDPVLINFHVSLTEKNKVSIKDFVKMLNTMIQCNPKCRKDVKLAAIIMTNTSKNTIEELKKTNIQGIIPHHLNSHPDIFDFSLQERVTAEEQILAGENYWPEHIISQLPDIDKKPLHIYFRKDHSTYITSEINKAVAIDSPWDTQYCSDWDELSESIKQEPKTLVFHISMIDVNGTTIPEFISMISTLIRVSNIKSKIILGVGIEIDTNLSVIKELQKFNEISGIIPSAKTIGLEETFNGINALMNDMSYWPKHILAKLPGAVKPKATATPELTPRQAQIVNLIAVRGLSNKHIAKSLNITENTVKTHLAAIFKHYGIRTRTQLAVVATK